MITVSQEQLDTVEYLLKQSAQGNHVLFDPEMVRQVFTVPSFPMSEEHATEVEHHLEKLISLESIQKQKAYLGLLSVPELHRVVKTYFNILENQLFESGSARH